MLGSRLLLHASMQQARRSCQDSTYQEVIEGMQQDTTGALAALQ
jgi:hypothetical protein